MTCGKDGRQARQLEACAWVLKMQMAGCWIKSGDVSGLFVITGLLMV